MKTNEFIELLQIADPTSQAEVCVGNCPVKDVNFLPYYYDGRQQYIEYDKDENGWTIPVKGGYPSGTFKLNIQYDTLEDALLENPDMELILDGITYQGVVDPMRMETINKWIEEGRKYQAWRTATSEARSKGLPLPPIPCEEKPKHTLLRKFYNWFMSLEPTWLK